jgi:PAP2 superfamily
LLREAEWINAAFFVSMSILAMTMRLERHQRTQALLLGATGLLLTLAGVATVPMLPAASAGALRDWLPVVLVLIAYRQAGQLYVKPNRSLEASLARLDARLARALAALSGIAESRPVRLGLELAYLLAYPMVPLGLLALRLAEPDFSADQFWRVVLPAAYLCYMTLPFAPTRPPRFSRPDGSDAWTGAGRGPGGGRKVNLWILDRLGIGANTFPSGHVAATTATALVVASGGGLRAGVFLWMAAGVALSVVVRRYHYSADAFLGVALAVAVWWALGG